MANFKPGKKQPFFHIFALPLGHLPLQLYPGRYQRSVVPMPEPQIVVFLRRRAVQWLSPGGPRHETSQGGFHDDSSTDCSFSLWLREQRSQRDGLGLATSLTFHAALALGLWPSLSLLQRAYFCVNLSALTGTLLWQRSGHHSYVMYREVIGLSYRGNELACPFLLGMWASSLQAGAFVISHSSDNPWRAALHSLSVLAALPFVTFILPLLFAAVAVPVALPVHLVMQLVCTLRFMWQTPMMCGAPMFDGGIVRWAVGEAHALLQLLFLFFFPPLSPLTLAGSSGPTSSSLGSGGCMSPAPAAQAQQAERACQATLCALLWLLGFWLPTALQIRGEWIMFQRYCVSPHVHGRHPPAAPGGWGWVSWVDRHNDRWAAWMLPRVRGSWAKRDALLLVAAAGWAFCHATIDK